MRAEGGCLPFLQTIPKCGMITPKYDDQIDPTFRENVACVPVEDYAAIFDQRLQFVQDLLNNNRHAMNNSVEE